MRLYIAEKPSLGRALAAAIPGSHKPVGKTHIQLADGDIIAWSAGHILAQCPPDAYGEEFKSWNIERLPIIPGDWKMEVKRETKDLFIDVLPSLKEEDSGISKGSRIAPVLRLLLQEPTPRLF